MKKLITIILALVITLTLYACGTSPAATAPETSAPTATPTFEPAATPNPTVTPEPTPTPTPTVQYFDMSFSEFVEAFMSQYSGQFEIGANTGLGYPFHANGKTLYLYLDPDVKNGRGDTNEWNILKILVLDDSSINYDSDIAETAIDISIKCANVLGSSLTEEDFSDAFLNGADTAKKKWADDYNELQFWYSHDGFDFYLYDHPRMMGKFMHEVPVVYWYQLTISLSN